MPFQNLIIGFTEANPNQDTQKSIRFLTRLAEYDLNAIKSDKDSLCSKSLKTKAKNKFPKLSSFIIEYAKNKVIKTETLDTFMFKDQIFIDLIFSLPSEFTPLGDAAIFAFIRDCFPTSTINKKIELDSVIGAQNSWDKEFQNVNHPNMITLANVFRVYSNMNKIHIEFRNKTIKEFISEEQFYHMAQSNKEREARQNFIASANIFKSKKGINGKRIAFSKYKAKAIKEAKADYFNDYLFTFTCLASALNALDNNIGKLAIKNLKQCPNFLSEISFVNSILSRKYSTELQLENKSVDILSRYIENCTTTQSIVCFKIRYETNWHCIALNCNTVLNQTKEFKECENLKVEIMHYCLKTLD